VIVLGLAFLTLRFVLPQMLRLPNRKGQREIELLELLPLDRQSKIALLRVRGSAVLVGVSPNGVTRLETWPATAGEENDDAEGDSAHRFGASGGAL
jgi:flagellar biogenesis protein FliO